MTTRLQFFVLLFGAAAGLLLGNGLMWAMEMGGNTRSTAQLTGACAAGLAFAASAVGAFLLRGEGDEVF